MKRIDTLHTAFPFAGSRMLRLAFDGSKVGRRHVKTLMLRMGIEALYRKPRTTKPEPGHKIYPYLLRDVAITRPNHVWAMDITYIPMARGFVYLAAVLDWFSGRVLSWHDELVGGFDSWAKQVKFSEDLEAHALPAAHASSLQEIVPVAPSRQPRGLETATSAVLTVGFRDGGTLRLDPYASGAAGLIEKIVGMLEHADAKQLSVFSGSWTRTIELAELTSVSIVAWSEGPPTATADLNDGASFAIPSLCLPEKAVFVDALKRFGIALAVIGAGETHDRYCVSYVGNAPISGRGQRKAASIWRRTQFGPDRRCAAAQQCGSYTGVHLPSNQKRKKSRSVGCICRLIRADQSRLGFQPH